MKTVLTFLIVFAATYLLTPSNSLFPRQEEGLSFCWPPHWKKASQRRQNQILYRHWTSPHQIEEEIQISRHYFESRGQKVTATIQKNKGLIHVAFEEGKAIISLMETTQGSDITAFVLSTSNKESHQ
jgi:hypothetical protein